MLSPNKFSSEFRGGSGESARVGDSLSSAIEKWEELVRHYQDTRDAIADDVKAAALTEMCPDKLANHIRLNIFQFHKRTFLSSPGIFQSVASKNADNCLLGQIYIKIR